MDVAVQADEARAPEGEPARGAPAVEAEVELAAGRAAEGVVEDGVDVGNDTVVPRVTTSTCGSKRFSREATAGGCALLRAAGRSAPATQTTASAAGDVAPAGEGEAEGPA